MSPHAAAAARERREREGASAPPSARGRQEAAAPLGGVEARVGRRHREELERAASGVGGRQELELPDGAGPRPRPRGPQPEREGGRRGGAREVAPASRARERAGAGRAATARPAVRVSRSAAPHAPAAEARRFSTAASMARSRSTYGTSDITAPDCSSTRGHDANRPAASSAVVSSERLLSQAHRATGTAASRSAENAWNGPGRSVSRNSGASSAGHPGLIKVRGGQAGLVHWQ